MTLPLRANPELVAVAWIGTIPGLSPAMVATQLPKDNTTWAASGFVTVTPTGGDDQIDTEMRNPVIGISTWAINPGSSKAPWGHAAALMEVIRRAGYPRTHEERHAVCRLLTLGGGYPKVRVHSLYSQTGPRRVPDPGGAAHFTADFVMNWVDQS